MTRNPQLSLFFCEDFRLETGNKPFVIGLLSPVIYTDGGDEDDDDEFVLVTSVYMPPEVLKVELRLRVTISVPGRDDETDNFRTVLEGDDADTSQEPWSAYLPMPLRIKRSSPGARIEAILECDHGQAWASILVAGAVPQAGVSGRRRSPSEKRKSTPRRRQVPV